MQTRSARPGHPAPALQPRGAARLVEARGDGEDGIGLHRRVFIGHERERVWAVDVRQIPDLRRPGETLIGWSSSWPWVAGRALAWQSQSIERRGSEALAL